MTDPRRTNHTGWYEQLHPDAAPSTRSAPVPPRAEPPPRAVPPTHAAPPRAPHTDPAYPPSAAHRPAPGTGGATVRPIADELFRGATDAFTGATRINHRLVDIGCAAALVAELMLTWRDDPVHGRQRLLRTFPAAETGTPVLAPDHRLYLEAPPRDPLCYRVLSEIVEDARDQRRPVVEFIEYLSDRAYRMVGERLAMARLMVEEQRRSGLRRRQVFLDVEPTASVNALTRLPRKLRDREPVGEADRVLFGLYDAIGLMAVVRREFSDHFPMPTDLRLTPDLQSVLDAASELQAVVTRRH
ncbi:GPP34 family phosphoprotein [Actinocatenispora sera]|uniref:GPP34 family phosphoprotein n=1 Tax=Actinocatenispora sera TaxID=390989 RepID=UPI0033F598C8